jgi:LacI family transcriptional regulator
MVRIKDVAEHAGVSTATVSRVINGKRVRPQFREAVERSVNELGFRPNRQARLLRLQRSNEVALILPDIENPFYTALARGVIDVTRAGGYSAGLWNSDDLADKEDAYLSAIRDDNVAGVIIVASTPNPKIKDLMADGRAIVAVDRPIALTVDSVTLDNVALGRRGTADLVLRGYRRIACITGPTTSRTAVDRADGWRKEMRRHKLVVGGLLRRGNARVDGGRTAAEELMALPEPPDAILTANSLIAVGVLQVLDELGERSIGLSVIGDLPFATSRPPNTKIIPLNPRALGETAAQMLIERISGLRARPRAVVQPVADPEGLSWP